MSSYEVSRIFVSAVCSDIGPYREARKSSTAPLVVCLLGLWIDVKSETIIRYCWECSPFYWDHNQSLWRRRRRMLSLHYCLTLGLRSYHSHRTPGTPLKTTIRAKKPRIRCVVHTRHCLHDADVHIMAIGGEYRWKGMTCVATIRSFQHTVYILANQVPNCQLSLVPE